jgi:glycosyltransferase involved in cell wall biosynthesis
MNELKSIHMTSVHPAFDTRIYHKQCRTLADEGYEVVLIAQHNADEEREGIRIKAVSTPRSRLGRVFGTSCAVLVKAFNEGTTAVYHFHDPELIPGGLFLRLLGRKVIYDVHENVPKQISGKGWIPRDLRAVVGWGVGLLERLGARLFSGVVAATPAIACRFPSAKTVLVQNTPILGELQVSNPTPYVERPPWVAYVGGITPTRGIREMVSAFYRLPESFGTRLRLAGSFMPESLKHDVQAIPGWDRVDYMGWQSREQVASLLDVARIGLVVLHPLPNYVEAQPVKLFEYMSAGIPVIASDFPLWRKIIDEAGCGLLVDPLDPEAIAEAIQYLIVHPVEAQEMGERGQKTVLEKYNWGMEAERLLSLYRRMAEHCLS